MIEEINKWFISPDGENREYITNFFTKIINQLIREKSISSEKELVPVCSEDSSFVDDLANGHSLEQILEKLQVIYDESMNASSKGYIGQMDSIPNLGALLGDLITAAVNNNMLANEMSPILSWLEINMVRQFSDWFGFDKHAGGVMTSGGTLGNIQALTLARNVKLNITDGNLFHIKKQPVFFASEHAHSSIAKAGMLLGIGNDNVIKIKADNTGRMSMDALREQITQSLASDKLPFAVVSTYGTTNSGSLDDVDTVQKICDEYNLWHHIDAIYGGAMMLSPNQQHLCPVFSKADSLSFNPQKWMYVSKTCSVLIFKDFHQLDTHFKIPAPYVKQGDKINLGEYGIQGSRHTSVLKLWLSLYLIGKNQYADLIDLNMEITQSFTTFISDHAKLELYAQPDLNIILFRPSKSPEGTDEEYKGKLADFQEYLYSLKNYVSLIPWGGELWLKCIFLNPYFNQEELVTLKHMINDYFDQSNK